MPRVYRTECQREIRVFSCYGSSKLRPIDAGTNLRTITSHEAEAAFSKVIEAARREPVAVSENGKPSAVVLSFDDYQRITGAAKRELIETMQRMREYATSQGLTEAKLDELLADDS